MRAESLLGASAGGSSPEKPHCGGGKWVEKGVDGRLPPQMALGIIAGKIVYSGIILERPHIRYNLWYALPIHSLGGLVIHSCI